MTSDKMRFPAALLKKQAFEQRLYAEVVVTGGGALQRYAVVSVFVSNADYLEAVCSPLTSDTGR